MQNESRNQNLSILIIDDEALYREEIGEFLGDHNFRVLKAATPSEAFQIFREEEVDIAILDIRLPEMDGLSMLKKIKEDSPDTEVIMISGHGDMDSVIQALRYGATDFFSKPFRLANVLHAIERTKRFLMLSKKLREAEQSFDLISAKLNEKYGQIIVGDSKAMKNVTDLIARVAKSDDTSVLILGESGTGKELIARAIHYMSSRKDKYFYAVNSSAITESLFESEFFGHKKGSFTGASDDRAGWFEIANGGTLFLDEIGDLPMNLQTKFLRVLEEKKISRVGTTTEIDINVRVVAATHQDLRKLSGEKNFRLDLYHRLNSFVIEVPPLRSRKEDIPLLLEHFSQEHTQKMNKASLSIDPSIYEGLMQYSFPGNIRELRNMVERAVILCDGKKLMPKHFELNKLLRQPENLLRSDNEIMNLDVIERNAIIQSLKQSNYNKSQASRLLGISFQSLDRRIKKFNLKFEKKLSI